MRQQDLVENDDAIVKYNTWFVFDLDIDEGRTVADMFLAQRGWTVGPDERQFIERLRAVMARARAEAAAAAVADVMNATRTIPP